MFSLDLYLSYVSILRVGIPVILFIFIYPISSYSRSAVDIFPSTYLLLSEQSFIATKESLQDPKNIGKSAYVNSDIDLGESNMVLVDNITLVSLGGVITNGKISNIYKITGNKNQLFDLDVYFDDPYRGIFYPEWYGAKADGLNDDTSAFRASFNNAQNIYLTAGKTYNIKSSISVYKKHDLTIEGRNATIVSRNSPSLESFIFEKTLNKITINNLIFDGKNKKGRAFYLKTDFSFNKVTVKNLLETTSTVYAYRIDAEKQLNKSEFINCECDSIDAGENHIIGDGDGAARCFYINWKNAVNPSTIHIQGGTFKNVWGDDGDVIQVAQLFTNYHHKNKLIVRDAYLGNASRRLIKGTSSGIELYDNVFESADSNNEKVATTTPAGMITFSLYNDSATPDERNLKGVMIGNIFNGEGGYDGRIVFNKASELTVKGNTFVSADLVFSIAVGDVEVRNNTFLDGAIINLQRQVMFEGTVNLVDNTIKHAEGSGPYFRGWVNLDDSGSIVNNLNILNNSLETFTGIDDTVFGLVYAGINKGFITNLVIDNNQVFRKGQYESNEILRIDTPLDNTTTISNNYMESPTFSAELGIDLNGANRSTPTVINNQHSSGGVYPEYQ